MEYLKIILLFAFATLLHELGHVVFFKIYKVPVRKIQIFYFEIVEVNLSRIKLALGILPIGGFTIYQVSKYNALSTNKKILITFGGIFVNLLFVLIGLSINKFDFWFFINVFKLGFNLIPMPGNDFYNAIKLFLDGRRK